MITFFGEVIRGDGMGKKLGFPTANLDCSRGDVGLEAGVYSCIATLKNKKYKGALAILDKPWRAEVFLIDYSGDDFYGESLSVKVGEKVSEMKKIETEEELVKKIKKDIEYIKEI